MKIYTNPNRHCISAYTVTIFGDLRDAGYNKQELEDDRKLLQSRLTLMENQGKSAEEQIEVMQAIQKNLHDEAEYLRE